MSVAAEPSVLSPVRRRIDALLYSCLVALVAASTLNGFAVDLNVLGAEITIRPDQIAVLALFAVVACAFLMDRFRFRLTLFDWVVLGFLVTNLVSSILFSPARRASLQASILLGVYAAMCFVVKQILARRAEWISGLGNWVLGLGIAQALYSILALALYARGQVIQGVQRGHLTESSVASTGTFWEANLLGAYLGVIAVFLIVRYMWKPEAEPGRTLLFGVFVTSLVLPLSMTRAAALAFALGLAAVLGISWRFRSEIAGWGRKTAAIAVVLASVVLLTVTAMNSFVSSLSEYPNYLVERWVPASWIPVSFEAPVKVETAVKQEAARPARPDGAPRPAEPPAQTRPVESELIQASRSSVDGRVEVWRTGVQEWRQNPIIGHGTLAGVPVVKDGWWYSSLVQALYDTGLLGFVLLLFIHAGSILYPLRSWISHRQSPMSANLLGFAAGNGVIFLTSQFSNSFFVGFPWVFLGLSMGAVDAYSKGREGRRKR